MSNGDFHGLPTVLLDNGHLTVEILQNAGPRIVRLIPAGSNANLFAETPQIQLPSPHGPYSLYGGHRLWHAPEYPARTYTPDDSGVIAHVTPHGARLHRPADPHSHIAKSIDIALSDAGPTVNVRHSLRNEGHWPVKLAAWAITQLPVGGVAILPQRETPADKDGVLPNRHFVLWPYTRWADPRLEAHDDFILVHGRADMAQRFKIGYMNHHHWAAHLAHGYLFIKQTQPQPQQPHADMGCNTELYTDAAFLELETISPLVTLDPGAELVHTETWEVHPAPDLPPTMQAIHQHIIDSPIQKGAASLPS